MSDSNTMKPANVAAAASEGEQAERDELLRDVLDSYIKKGPNFHHRNAPDVVAFTDDGNQLSTQFDNEEVVDAMVKVADSRGWGPMLVTGNNGFYTTAESILDRPRAQNAIEQVEREKTVEVERANVAQDQTSEAKASDPISGANAGEKLEQEGLEEDLRKAFEARRKAALAKVSDQYRVAGSRYYFKDYSGNVSVLAFRDAGTKLTTTLNSERVSISLVDMAQSKGWDAIKVSGHSEFRERVWREATERGINVRGYKPTERDLASLKTAKENTVEKMEPAPEKSESRSSVKARPTSKRVDFNSGRLVSFGPAPYKHQKDQSPSYQATIESGGKDRTIWSLDLERAIDESGASVGDAITLTHLGRKQVSVEVDEKDKDGVVVGVKTINTHRNSWSIERQDKAKVIEAVGSAVVAAKVANPDDRNRIEEGIVARINAHQGPLPTVPMHDNARAETSTRKSEKEKAPEIIR